MQSSTSTLIAIFVATVLLFVVPLVTLTERNDNVVQEKVKVIVEEFVTDIKNTGELTIEKYQDFENRLSATGNTYDIELELQILDENPGKKTMQANYTKIGENVYYSEYTTQVLEKLDSGKIILKEGDLVYVEVANQNSTASQTLKSTFLSFTNAGEDVITANSSGMVSVNGAK